MELRPSDSADHIDEGQIDQASSGCYFAEVTGNETNPQGQETRRAFPCALDRGADRNLSRVLTVATVAIKRQQRTVVGEPGRLRRRFERPVRNGSQIARHDGKAVAGMTRAVGEDQVLGDVDGDLRRGAVRQEDLPSKASRGAVIDAARCQPAIVARRMGATIANT